MGGDAIFDGEMMKIKNFPKELFIAFGGIFQIEPVQRSILKGLANGSHVIRDFHFIVGRKIIAMQHVR
jgi:hypothetical protein